MGERPEHPTKFSELTAYELDPLTSTSPADTILATPLEPRWLRYLPITLLLTLASAWVGTTIWLSIALSGLGPLFSLQPKTSIFILQVFSTGSAILLGQLVPQMFEHLRWTFGSRRGGIGFDTFLGLGSATGTLGVIKLLLRRSTLFHRLWCSQRYSFCIF